MVDASGRHPGIPVEHVAMSPATVQVIFSLTRPDLLDEGESVCARCGQGILLADHGRTAATGWTVHAATDETLHSLRFPSRLVPLCWPCAEASARRARAQLPNLRVDTAPGWWWR